MRTLLLFLALTSTALAHRSAQEAAEASARGGLCHRGGHSPFAEGLGCASTPEGAFRSCCYANHSGYATVDVGIAQARNGLWVCCRRYLSKSRLHLLPEYLARKGLSRRKSTLADCWVKEEVVDEDTSTDD